jgi:hypothetical protein
MNNTTTLTAPYSRRPPQSKKLAPICLIAKDAAPRRYAHTNLQILVTTNHLVFPTLTMTTSTVNPQHRTTPRNTNYHHSSKPFPEPLPVIPRTTRMNSNPRTTPSSAKNTLECSSGPAGGVDSNVANVRFHLVPQQCGRSQPGARSFVIPT